MVGTTADSAGEHCVRLRALVHDCLAKHMYEAAAFFADKLVTLSSGSQPDVYILAQAYFMDGQHRRCLALLRGAQLLDDVRFLYLAAKCLAATCDWEECLTVLGGWDAPDPEPASEEDVRSGSRPKDISYGAATSLLRGHAFAALENHGRALRCYRAALLADPRCYEAFRVLTEKHMLTAAEEWELVQQLHFAPEDAWLQTMYKVASKKYGREDEVNGWLQQLERSLPATETLNGTSTADSLPQTPAQQPGRATPARGLYDTLAPSSQESTEAMSIADDGGHADGAQAGGCGLGDNLAVQAARADWLHHSRRFQECYDLTELVLERDPYALECLPAHLASAVELRKKNELFLRGHMLVQEYPQRAVSWFAVGCYYMCTRQHEAARRYFGRATTVDPNFAPAWVGFGNAFALQDESDQAMAAYRTAARLFPGLHLPLVGMGMEYQRMNNLHLAEQMFGQAKSICSTDPMVWNELAVLAFRNGDLDLAARWLQTAMQLVPKETGLMQPLEPMIVNLAHVLRKQQRYEQAEQYYMTALSFAPSQAGTLAALAYTCLLQGGKGNVARAIKYYHKALSLRPEDTLSTEMLTIALQEDCWQHTEDRLETEVLS